MRRLVALACLVTACGQAPAPAAPSAPSATEPEAPPAGALLLTVRGRVVGPGGAPLTDFEVLEPTDLFGSSGRTRIVSPDGTFELRRDVPAAIGFAADALAPTLVRLGPHEPGATIDIGTVALTPGGTLAGRVTAGGAPVAGATMRLERGALEEGFRTFSVEARADAAGRFAIDRLTPGASTLCVRAEGWALHAEEVHIVEGEVLALDVELVRGTTLSGRVTGADGTAVPDASVQLTPSDPGAWQHHRQTRADGDGRYVIQHVTSGAYQLTACRGGVDPFAAIAEMRASQLELVVDVRETLERDLVLPPR